MPPVSPSQVRFAILDEADQMLDMGFEEDMEKILSQSPSERQTLLFSATLPKWVNKVARRFQRNPLTVDLVGAENTGEWIGMETKFFFFFFFGGPKV